MDPLFNLYETTIVKKSPNIRTLEGEEVVHKLTTNKIMRAFLMVDRPLTEKMIIIFTVIVVVPMIIVGAISYVHSTKVLEQETRQYNWQMIEQVKVYIEDYLRDYEITTLKIVNHSDIVEFLKMNSKREIEQSGIIHDVTNVLRNEAFSKSDIANITLILEDLSIVDSAGLVTENTVNELQEQYWYHTFSGVGYPGIVSRTIDWHDRQIPVISVVKRIVHPYTLQPFGILIIDLNYQRLHDVARKISPGQTGHLFIIDQDGHYVYHPDLKKLGNIYKTEYWTKMTEQTSGSFSSSERNPDLITFSNSQQLGWTLATAIPYHEVNQGVVYINRIIVWTTIITLFIVFLIGYTFSRSLLRPIKRLTNYISKVDEENFSCTVPVESRDEIGQLTEGYNKMMCKISNLVHEVYIAQIKESELLLHQKETELKALQSQMDPHFLYNSLETIRGMALENDEEDIAAISFSMGKLLRYNLREQSKIVLIKQEIEMSTLYLRIQKYRFNEKLDYNINLPDWCMEQKIARFSLQPIIENSVIHGIETSIGPTTIEVTAKKESATTFKLLIIDTGAGMTKDIKQKIEVDLKEKDISDGGSHIGLVNVHRRNQLLFGQEFGLSIEKSDSNGTVIGIILPFEGR